MENSLPDGAEAFGMVRLDSGPMGATGAPPLICPVRNEMEFLPHFLRHHRAIGVKEFVFIDNVSTDGTTDYLRAQPDCHVYQTAQPYAQSNFAADWVNWVVGAHFRGRWVIYLDCDELLVFPRMEERDVSAFCAELEREGADTLYAAMLDMYSDGNFLTTRLRPEDNFAHSMGCFDADYRFRAWPQRPWDPKPPKFRLEVLGGPKWRLMRGLNLSRPSGALHDTYFNVLARTADRTPEAWVPLAAALMPVQRPAQHKQPINFATSDKLFLNSHTSCNVRLSSVNAALLHLKFCGNLAKRFQLSRQEGQHYLRGIPDEQLRDAVTRWGARSLVYENTHRYRGSQSLTSLGIIGDKVSALWRDGVPVVEASRAPA